MKRNPIPLVAAVLLIGVAAFFGVRAITSSNTDKPEETAIARTDEGEELTTTTEPASPNLVGSSSASRSNSSEGGNRNLVESGPGDVLVILLVATAAGTLFMHVRQTRSVAQLPTL